MWWVPPGVRAARRDRTGRHPQPGSLQRLRGSAQPDPPEDAERARAELLLHLGRRRGRGSAALTPGASGAGARRPRPPSSRRRSLRPAAPTATSATRWKVERSKTSTLPGSEPTPSTDTKAYRPSGLVADAVRHGRGRGDYRQGPARFQVEELDRRTLLEGRHQEVRAGDHGQVVRAVSGFKGADQRPGLAVDLQDAGAPVARHQHGAPPRRGRHPGGRATGRRREAARHLEGAGCPPRRPGRPSCMPSTGSRRRCPSGHRGA